MNTRALVLRILQILAITMTTISVLIAAVTISFRGSPTDDPRQRSLWSSVIAVSAGTQILLTIVGTLWYAALAADTRSTALWSVVLVNSAAAGFAIIYAGCVASSRDGVALGAVALIITVTYSFLKAARMFIY